MDVPKVK